LDSITNALGDVRERLLALIDEDSFFGLVHHVDQFNFLLKEAAGALAQVLVDFSSCKSVPLCPGLEMLLPAFVLVIDGASRPISSEVFSRLRRGLHRGECPGSTRPDEALLLLSQELKQLLSFGQLAE